MTLPKLFLKYLLSIFRRNKQKPDHPVPEPKIILAPAQAPTVVIKPDLPSWAYENGKEKVWYAEDSTGRIFFTNPWRWRMKPVSGYALKSTTEPRQMDRLFRRMHEQEREHNERVIERLFYTSRDKYESARSKLRQKMASSSTSPAERNMIEEALKLMDARDRNSQENHAVGMSEMERSEAPLEGTRERVTV